jgi:glutathione S-transferase
MAVRLHRCRNEWVKIGGHPCWKVEKALQEAGIDYEVVPGPVRSSKRDHIEEHTGQRRYPAIEFENGVWYREESADMARTIREGRLMEKSGGTAATTSG